MRVVELHSQDEADWDEYVRNSPAAVPYHLVGWKRVMERTYGYSSYFLMAKQGGRIEGILPLLDVRSRLLGHSLTTLPGGLCTEDEEAAAALIERAKELTIKANALYLTIRDSRREWDAGLVSVSRHCTMIRDLPSQPDALLGCLPRDVRRGVRAALKSDLQVSIGGKEYLDEFYDVLCAFLRDVGTPVFGRVFLSNIAEEMGDDMLICCARWQGQLIGAYCALLLGDTMFGLWGGSLHRYLGRRPNHILYWRHMQYGCEHGFKRLDLGRSQLDSGQYKFKRGWGAKPQTLYQQHFPNGPRAVPDPSAQIQTDCMYRLFTWLWRRSPLSLTRRVGPQLRRHLPFG